MGIYQMVLSFQMTIVLTGLYNQQFQGPILLMAGLTSRVKKIKRNNQADLWPWPPHYI